MSYFLEFDVIHQNWISRQQQNDAETFLMNILFEKIQLHQTEHPSKSAFKKQASSLEHSYVFRLVVTNTISFCLILFRNLFGDYWGVLIRQGFFLWIPTHLMNFFEQSKVRESFFLPYNLEYDFFSLLLVIQRDLLILISFRLY